MSIRDNDTLAHDALAIGHDAYTGGCIVCGQRPVEHHEIIGRVMRHSLGAVPCIIGFTVAPLCQEHHREWEKVSTEEQLRRLQIAYCNDTRLQAAAVAQIVALKSRVR